MVIRTSFTVLKCPVLLSNRSCPVYSRPSRNFKISAAYLLLPEKPFSVCSPEITGTVRQARGSCPLSVRTDHGRSDKLCGKRRLLRDPADMYGDPAETDGSDPRIRKHPRPCPPETQRPARTPDVTGTHGSPDPVHPRRSGTRNCCGIRRLSQ